MTNPVVENLRRGLNTVVYYSDRHRIEAAIDEIERLEARLAATVVVDTDVLVRAERCLRLLASGDAQVASTQIQSDAYGASYEIRRALDARS